MGVGVVAAAALLVLGPGESGTAPETHVLVNQREPAMPLISLCMRVHFLAGGRFVSSGWVGA